MLNADFAEYKLLVLGSIVSTDDLRSDNVLNGSEFKHCPITHIKIFAETHNQVNDIENCWTQAKRRLQISSK